MIDFERRRDSVSPIARRPFARPIGVTLAG